MKSKDTQKVVLRMTDDARRSARKLANSLGVSKGTIGRIIHDDLHLHVYHATIQSNLKDEHKQGRISFAYWQDVNEHKGIRWKAKFPKRIMIWLAVSKNGRSIPIIFKPGETLTHENYIKIVLAPHALSEGRRLLDDDFIYQQDNTTPQA
ncbi:unnamed protein product [Rotaria magnacalcarata]|uniref:Transposase n=1 Tax=Rotaria magnacalcarata TaxID=392030 RepID=A0A819J9W4_9BILA|nr:unnamed protein product [Rotaria magnacalcarata]CAF2224590.1 unnamed protein product [Rotaria magnacalcarata]CAF3926869.1 unnamed protein product [Rotaria magnacalcarata]CAF4008384.1 unnamed protein product [Rotaria magnacalcarata]